MQKFEQYSTTQKVISRNKYAENKNHRKVKTYIAKIKVLNKFDNFLDFLRSLELMPHSSFNNYYSNIVQKYTYFILCFAIKIIFLKMRSTFKW